MSSPLISLNDDAYIYDAALVMSKYSIRRLPIIRDNVLLGIVTATDLARRLYEENSNRSSFACDFTSSLSQGQEVSDMEFHEGTVRYV